MRKGIKRMLADAWWYLCECAGEEFVCRILLLWVPVVLGCPPMIALVLSSLIYAFAHLILFRWPMVVACIPFGIFLGMVFLAFPPYVGILLAWGYHWVIGVFAWKVGITSRWIKERR